MPTGKNKSMNGGGGSGGNIKGRTTMHNARTASASTDPKLIHCTMILTTSSDFRRRPCLSSPHQLKCSNATSANDKVDEKFLWIPKTQSRSSTPTSTRKATNE
ncbi:hypothetical protein ACFX13_029041 [Malus domestica]